MLSYGSAMPLARGAYGFAIPACGRISSAYAFPQIIDTRSRRCPDNWGMILARQAGSARVRTAYGLATADRFQLAARKPTKDLGPIRWTARKKLTRTCRLPRNRGSPAWD